MQKIIYLSLLVLYLLNGSISAQEVVVFTLEDITAISREESLSARKAYVRKLNSYWDWQIYRSGLRPNLVLDADLLDFSKGVTPILQDDGTYELKTVTLNRSSLNLQLLQPVRFLGGNIFIQSSISRFDNLLGNSFSYSAHPVEAGISFPINGFNQMKWDKHLEKMKYNRSNLTYCQDLEISVYKSVSYFLDYLSDRYDFDRAEKNLKLNRDLFFIANEKKERGEISNDEFIQVRLMMVNAEKNANSAAVEMENSQLLLLTQLSLTEIEKVIPTLPDEVPELIIDTDKARDVALMNNPFMLNGKIEKMVAEMQVEKAKRTTGIGGNVFASYGYGGDFDALKYYSQDLNDQAVLQVGIQVPVLDWGRAKAVRKKADMNLELVNTTIDQEYNEFIQRVASLVNRTTLLYNNIDGVKLSFSLAEQRYEIARKKYLAGEISVMELNIAQQDKDNASREMMGTIAAFWMSYYELRLITLYDFLNDESLINK